MGDLSQEKADSLLAIQKCKIDDKVWDYPSWGGKVKIPLKSVDGTESFFLDISSSRYNLSKRKYQNRTGSIVLIRLDTGGTGHRNPDGTIIGPDHVDIYRQGFGAKWAFNVPTTKFSDIGNPQTTLFDFMKYCNIVEMPLFSGGIFP